MLVTLWTNNEEQERLVYMEIVDCSERVFVGTLVNDSGT